MNRKAMWLVTALMSTAAVVSAGTVGPKTGDKKSDQMAAYSAADSTSTYTNDQEMQTSTDTKKSHKSSTDTGTSGTTGTGSSDGSTTGTGSSSTSN